MVFRRRDSRPIWKVIAEFLWPRGGWKRASSYVFLRMRRLPDAPERIARGIAAGVLVTFTPFYGLHFVIAAFVALILRANVLAAMLGTFFGNPLTYVPIGVVSLKTGFFVLGTEFERQDQNFIQKFYQAGRDLKQNLHALFHERPTNWHNLEIFYDEVFFPYLIGGIAPGIIMGVISYYVSLPLIQAYQNRRKGALKAKFAALKNKAHSKSERARVKRVHADENGGNG